MTKAKRSDQRDSQVTFRIPTWLHDELRRDADEQRRSVADVLVLLLEDHYSKRKGK